MQEKMLKQNPCRYCKLSMEYKGKHFPNYSCNENNCKNLKEHKRYLMSSRKYCIGDAIESMEELMNQTYVYVGKAGTPKHIEYIRSWQYRIIENVLDKKHFYKAVRKQEVSNEDN